MNGEERGCGNRQIPSKARRGRGFSCAWSCGRTDAAHPAGVEGGARTRGRGRLRGGPGGKGRQSHRKDWTKLLISLSNSGSRLRMVSIFRTEWMTVEWCLPPNPLPISGREALVRALVRYIAI